MEEPANMDSVEKAARNDDEVMLPGFRFHPTDEELVGFYLRRKVEKKAIRLEIIKQIDIYKYDPWDLPKVSSAGDREWYFFCIRGRKYRNSIRPNRVTGSGFWKATGIDKPIYTVKEPHQCIGLKKSLVYYRGSAGKGTKTDWMMHEFRLPPPPTDKHSVVVPTEGQQPEVWTLCRIFKRIPSIHKKYAEAAAATWKDSSRIEQKLAADVDRGLICSKGSLDDWDQTQSYSINEPCMSFCDDSSSSAVLMRQLDPKVKPDLSDQVDDDESNNFIFLGQWSTTNSIAQHHHQAVPSFSASNNIYPASVWDPNGEIDVFPDGNWDELRSVVEFGIEPYPPRIFS